MSTTSPTLLFHNTAGRVLAEPAGFLHVEWSSQPRQLADTQALLGALAQAMRQYHWGRVLTDQTLMTPLTPQEQQWASQEWLPHDGRPSGYRYGAVLVAANVLSRLATASITASQDAGYPRYRSFDTLEAARAWLLRQPQ